MTILLSKTGYWRRLEFRLQTDIIKQGKTTYVVKTALGKKSKHILQQAFVLYHRLKKGSMGELRLVKPIKQENKLFYFEFCPGITLEKLIEDNIIEKKYHQAGKYYYQGQRLISHLPSKKYHLGQISQFKDFFEIPLKFQKLKWDFINFPFSEITAEHIFWHNSQYYLIDYEPLLEVPLPKQYLIFRYQFHLFNTLHQLFTTLSSEKLPLVTYLNNLFVPQDWPTVYHFTDEEKELLIGMEEKVQNFTNWEKTDYRHFLKSDNKIIDYRLNGKLYRALAEKLYSQSNNQEQIEKLNLLRQELDGLKVSYNQIISSKFFKVWRKYCRAKEKIRDLAGGVVH
jgi:hypothetical protein